MRAQFAMIGMIDSDESVDARFGRRLKLVELQLALEGGKHTEIDALQSDRLLLQVDDFHARDRAQDVRGRFHDAGNAWVLM